LRKKAGCKLPITQVLFSFYSLLINSAQMN
jgi:hypothetical protein